MALGVGITSPTQVMLRAGQTLAVRGARVPVSRGLPCAILATPCPLTDGDLTAVDAGLLEDVTFELVPAVTLSAVVLRGADVPYQGKTSVVLTGEDGGLASAVEESVSSQYFNGSPWRPFTLRDGGYSVLRVVYRVIPLDAGFPVRSVTVHFSEGLAGIQEISLFE